MIVAWGLAPTELAPAPKITAVVPDQIEFELVMRPTNPPMCRAGIVWRTLIHGGLLGEHFFYSPLFGALISKC